ALLALIFVCCVSVILLLYASGLTEKSGGGFERIFYRTSAHRLTTMDLQATGYYIAGNAGDVVYLAHPSSPYRTLIVSKDSGQLKKIDRNRYSIAASTLMIDSPFFYLADIVNYAIYRGELSSLRIDTLVFDRVFFSEALMVGEKSVLRRTLSQNSNEYTFQKEGPD